MLCPITDRAASSPGAKTRLTDFILPGSRHIDGFLLFPKILPFGKPSRLPLAALQVAFSILIHFSASGDTFGN
jgi:hypothetical protein